MYNIYLTDRKSGCSSLHEVQATSGMSLTGYPSPQYTQISSEVMWEAYDKGTAFLPSVRHTVCRRRLVHAEGKNDFTVI